MEKKSAKLGRHETHKSELIENSEPSEHLSPEAMRRYERGWKTDRQREAEKLGKSTVKNDDPILFILAAIGVVLILAIFLGLFFIKGR